MGTKRPAIYIAPIDGDLLYCSCKRCDVPIDLVCGVVGRSHKRGGLVTAFIWVFMWTSYFRNDLQHSGCTSVGCSAIAAASSLA